MPIMYTVNDGTLWMQFMTMYTITDLVPKASPLPEHCTSCGYTALQLLLISGCMGTSEYIIYLGRL